MVNKTIWKFELEITDEQLIDMPVGAEIMPGSLDQQDKTRPTVVQIWALVDPQARKVKRRFRIYGTGHPVDEMGNYLGSVLIFGGAQVYHLFEVNSIKRMV